MVTRVCAKAGGTTKKNDKATAAMREKVTFVSSMHDVMWMGRAQGKAVLVNAFTNKKSNYSAVMWIQGKPASLGFTPSGFYAGLHIQAPNASLRAAVAALATPIQPATVGQSAPAVAATARARASQVPSPLPRGRADRSHLRGIADVAPAVG
jgi:hypothetical protein